MRADSCGGRVYRCAEWLNYPHGSVSRGFQALFVACILVASTAMFALAESRKLDRAPIKALVLSAGPAIAGHAAAGHLLAELQLRDALRAHLVPPRQARARSRPGSSARRARSCARSTTGPHVRNVVLRWHGDSADGQAGAGRQLPAPPPDRGHDPHAAGLHRRATRSSSTSGSRSRRSRLTLNGDGVDDHAVDHLARARAALQRAPRGAPRRRQRAELPAIPIYRHARSSSFQWPKATCAQRLVQRQAAAGPGRVEAHALRRGRRRQLAPSIPLGTVQVANR